MNAVKIKRHILEHQENKESLFEKHNKCSMDIEQENDKKKNVEVDSFNCDEENYDYFEKFLKKNKVQNNTSQRKSRQKTNGTKCPYCFFTITETEDILHQRVHAPSTGQIYQCKFCSYKTMHEINITVHGLKCKNKPKVNEAINESLAIHGNKKTDAKKEYYIKDHGFLSNELLTEKKVNYSDYYAIKDENVADLLGQQALTQCIQCKECPYISTKLSHMKKHAAAHKRTDGEKCPNCTFRSHKPGLKMHRPVHESQRQQYLCNNCTYKTVYLHRMENHVLKYHINNGIADEIDKNLLCGNKTLELYASKCNLSTSEDEINSEYITNGAKCPYCLCLTTKTKEILHQHIHTHTTSIGDIFHCKFCTYKTLHVVNMTIHGLNCQKKIKVSTENPVKGSVTNKSKNGSKEKDANKEYFLESHNGILSNELLTEKVLNYSDYYDKDDEIKTERQDSTRNIQCNECPYMSNKLSSMKEHVKAHKRSDGEKCPNCSYRSNKSGLKIHNVLHESQRPQYLCKICAFKTVYLYKINFHVLNYHIKNIGTVQNDHKNLRKGCTKTKSLDVWESSEKYDHSLEYGTVEREMPYDMDQDSISDSTYVKIEIKSENESECENEFGEVIQCKDDNMQESHTFLKLGSKSGKIIGDIEKMDTIQDELKIPECIYVKAEIKSENESERNEDESTKELQSKDALRQETYQFLEELEKKNKKMVDDKDKSISSQDVFLQTEGNILESDIKSQIKDESDAEEIQSKDPVKQEKYSLELNGNTFENPDYVHCDESGKVLEDHGGEKQFKWHECPDVLCPYKTNKSCHLKNHIKLHQKTDGVKCPVCTYRSPTKRTLGRHISSHGRIQSKKTYHCPFCSFKTILPYCMQRHELTCKYDTRDRDIINVSCTECPYKTVRVSYLKKHLKCHFMTVGIMCEYCSFRALRMNNLYAHMKLHEEYRAKVENSDELTCKYDTRDRDIINVSCTECPYKTVRASYLKKHLKYHFMTVGIMCEYCSFRALQMNNLYAHMKLHEEYRAKVENSEEPPNAVLPEETVVADV